MPAPLLNDGTANGSECRIITGCISAGVALRPRIDAGRTGPVGGENHAAALKTVAAWAALTTSATTT